MTAEQFNEICVKISRYEELTEDETRLVDSLIQPQGDVGKSKRINVL